MGFKVGDLVQLTDDALDNYGIQYQDAVFTIIHAATNELDHPGYDDSVYPMGLYDLDGFNFSLYDYELKQA